MNSINIVLVEPISPGNIGSVCRAMANFGADELRLVNPDCNHLDKEAVKMAVFSEARLVKAVVYSNLAEAIADCHYSIAATRRDGSCRNKIQTLAETADAFSRETARIALVFGRERSGLTTDEVILCSHAAKIETTVDGSLNLAQAVVVFLYEMSKKRPAADTGEKFLLPEQRDYQSLFTTMESVLGRVGYLNPKKPGALMNKIRRIYQRVELDKDELNILRGIWSRLQESVNDWPGRRRG